MEINVLGTNYKIELTGNLNGSAGEYLPSNEKIVLTKYDKESYMFKTLWHEIVHAILYLNGDNELMIDEGFVQRTANAIAQILDDNKCVINSEEFSNEYIHK